MKTIIDKKLSFYVIGFISVLDFDVDEGGGHHGWDDTSPDPDGYEEGEEFYIFTRTNCHVDLRTVLIRTAMPDMRGIFFVNGPRFKENHTVPWIKLVDEYQVGI